MQLLKGQTPGTHTKKKKKKWNDHSSEPSASQKSTQVHSQLCFSQHFYTWKRI